VEWEGHNIESLEKFWVALDKEFEYLDNELFVIGFEKVVENIEEWVEDTIHGQEEGLLNKY
jgi:hypothetical protein